MGCVNSLIQKGSAVNEKAYAEKENFAKPPFGRETLAYLNHLQGKRKAHDEEYRTGKKILKFIMLVSVVCWAAVLALVIKHRGQILESYDCCLLYDCCCCFAVATCTIFILFERVIRDLILQLRSSLNIAQTVDPAGEGFNGTVEEKDKCNITFTIQCSSELFHSLRPPPPHPTAD
eukprot:scaffold1623_cov165-Ochromonas_danica.AAC.12